MSDENKIIISGTISTDLKITTFKDKEKKKDIVYVGFQIESAKKRVTKPAQPSNYAWVNCYKEEAEFANEYLAKGRRVLVEGTLETESWKDQKGNLRFKWFIKAEKITCINSPIEVPGQIAQNTWGNSAVNTSGLETTEFVSENPNS